MKALMDGYFGLWRILIFQILLISTVLILFYFSLNFADVRVALGIVYIGCPVLLIAGSVILFDFSGRPTRRMGLGLDWNSNGATWASLSMIFLGVFGYAIVSSKAFTGFKKYGVSDRFFRIKKSDVQARIEDLQRSSQAGPRFIRLLLRFAHDQH